MTEQSISADEVALYDRQIRLWGLDGQNRMRNSSVLLIGLNGLGTEVAKNLTLAGIGSLHIKDDTEVQIEDLSSCFFFSSKDIGTKRTSKAILDRISDLNPRVHIQATQSATYSDFSIVVLCSASYADAININGLCRDANVPFYYGGSFGLYGFIFADLITHEFVITRKSSPGTPRIGPETKTRTVLSVTPDGDNEIVKKKETYIPLSALKLSHFVDCFSGMKTRAKLKIPLLVPYLLAQWFNLDEPQTVMRQLDIPAGLFNEKTYSLLKSSETSQLSPVVAIIGGVLAQDVLNLIVAKEQPIQNLLIFDGDTMSSPIYSLS
ncbi:hypothetical protein CANCADRAFT_3848 [Tortispora caseinolytica NRRL Y-17796]|uniref:THIF-type NAD/FAD binding fold domain-containing protein n=1 Tax=Tortispora caseinolytica NRRL Y-17796 TaxID=767744 RepID=A0A1E4TBV4_9ASCO|nr:hypothetical protein CANCADRAFT_3848 [Tortispora caseinolytica NRRL Y-17796]